MNEWVMIQNAIKGKPGHEVLTVGVMSSMMLQIMVQCCRTRGICSDQQLDDHLAEVPDKFLAQWTSTRRTYSLW
jgi:hypothetical protein